MTPPAPWHPDEPVLQAYANGQAMALSGASIEAHLLGCARCRDQLSQAVPIDRLASLRARIEDRVDVLELSRLERLLIRLRMQEADVRALLAAPALRAAWCVAVLAAIGLGLLVLLGSKDPDALFLLLAPLLPVCTTAVAYAPALDPALPHVAATPYSTTRLLLARSLAVGVTAFVGTGAVALALPGRDLASVVWLLPAIALTLVALALSPRVGAAWAAALVGSAWVSFVMLMQREGVSVVAALGLAGQLVAGLLTAAALAVLVDQQKRIDEGGTP